MLCGKARSLGYAHARTPESARCTRRANKPANVGGKEDTHVNQLPILALTTQTNMKIQRRPQRSHSPRLNSLSPAHPLSNSLSHNRYPTTSPTSSHYPHDQLHPPTPRHPPLRHNNPNHPVTLHLSSPSSPTVNYQLHEIRPLHLYRRTPIRHI